MKMQMTTVNVRPMTGDDLKAGRVRLGLTQPQAARRIGVPVDTYRSWEHGRRSPREEHHAAIQALMAGEPTPLDQIAGLLALTTTLARRVDALTDRVTYLDAELARLSAR